MVGSSSKMWVSSPSHSKAPCSFHDSPTMPIYRFSNSYGPPIVKREATSKPLTTFKNWKSFRICTWLCLLHNWWAREVHDTYVCVWDVHVALPKKNFQSYFLENCFTMSKGVALRCVALLWILLTLHHTCMNHLILLVMTNQEDCHLKL